MMASELLANLISVFELFSTVILKVEESESLKIQQNIYPKLGDSLLGFYYMTQYKGLSQISLHETIFLLLQKEKLVELFLILHSLVVTYNKAKYQRFNFFNTLEQYYQVWNASQFYLLVMKKLIDNVMIKSVWTYGIQM